MRVAQHAQQKVAQGSLSSLAAFRCHSWKNRGPHEQDALHLLDFFQRVNPAGMEARTHS